MNHLEKIASHEARPIDTSSEAHRRECEARHVAAMKSDNDRHLFLEGVRQKRGEAAWERLRNDAWAAIKRGRKGVTVDFIASTTCCKQILN